MSDWLTQKTELLQNVNTYLTGVSQLPKAHAQQRHIQSLITIRNNIETANHTELQKYQTWWTTIQKNNTTE